MCTLLLRAPSQASQNDGYSELNCYSLCCGLYWLCMLYMYCSLIRAGSVLLFASLLSGIKLIQLAEITQQVALFTAHIHCSVIPFLCI